jgi:hypothetical protein
MALNSIENLDSNTGFEVEKEKRGVRDLNTGLELPKLKAYQASLTPRNAV